MDNADEVVGQVSVRILEAVPVFGSRMGKASLKYNPRGIS